MSSFKRDRIVCIVFWGLIFLWLTLGRFIVYYMSFIPEGKCIYRQILGAICPFCGGTRMVEQLLYLNFINAFRYNQLMFILGIFAILFMVWFTKNCFGKNYIQITFPDKPIKPMCMIFGILILYTLLRNSQMYPQLFRII